MKHFFKTLLQSSFLACVCYYIYIFPTKTFLNWGFNILVPTQNLILSTLLISACISYYLRTKTKSILLKNVTYLGFGSLYFIALTTTVIVGLNQFFTINNTTNIYVGISISSVLIIYAKYCGKIIKIKYLTFTSPKLTTKTTCVFISDIHIGSQSPKHLEKIVTKINFIKPEFVLIGGDLVDSSSTTINDLMSLKKINVPIYFVTGNHEYYLKDSAKLLSNLDKIGISWLNNQALTHNQFSIIGVNDNQSIEKKNKLITKKLNPNTYTIAVVHKPSCFDTLRKKPDLMLCGHTHNGQTFPFNLLVKLSFPKSYGLYKKEKKYLYVSSGAGTWGTKMRLGSSNEIIAITFTP